MQIYFKQLVQKFLFLLYDWLPYLIIGKGYWWDTQAKCVTEWRGQATAKNIQNFLWCTIAVRWQLGAGALYHYPVITRDAGNYKYTPIPQFSFLFLFL